MVKSYCGPLSLRHRFSFFTKLNSRIWSKVLTSKMRIPRPSRGVRNKWTDEEIRRLLIGYNRYYESSTVFSDIEKDPELRFLRVRSNVNIKDKIRTLEKQENLCTCKAFFVRNITNGTYFDPRMFIPPEYLHVFDQEDSDFEPYSVLSVEERRPLKPLLYKYSPHMAEIDAFVEHLQQLPFTHDIDPVRYCLTWNQMCRKYFNNSLDEIQKEELLKTLQEHAHVKVRVYGIRTYLYRYEQ